MEVKFSDETILKAVGIIKTYGYLKGLVKGAKQRGALFDLLIDDLNYINPDCMTLTIKGDDFLRANFCQFDKLINNLKSYD